MCAKQNSHSEIIKSSKYVFENETQLLTPYIFEQQLSKGHFPKKSTKINRKLVPLNVDFSFQSLLKLKQSTKA